MTAISADRWKSIGDRAMRRGQFTITKYGEGATVQYGLYGSGPEMLAHDADYRVLMARADELERAHREAA